MRQLAFISTIFILLVTLSCSKDDESPNLECGNPSEENYIIGQVDTICILAETNEKWFNFPETVSRFECGRLLKSDLVNYDDDVMYSVLLSISHVNGTDCGSLSPDAIQIGKYEFLKNSGATDQGQAGFSLRIDRKLYATWASDLVQGPDSYIEVVAVEDVTPSPTWSYATQYKRVTGKINCRIKEINSNEEPIEVRNLEFSLFMVY